MKKKGKNSEIIVEQIVSRFLKYDYKPEQFENIDDILKLPITAIRGLDAIEAAQAHDLFGVETINDLAKLDPVNPIEKLLPKNADKMDPQKFEAQAKIVIEKVLQEMPDFESFRNHVSVANMISRAWSKRTLYLKKKETKMICVGLDNAGKTAILSSLGGRLGISDLAKLKPTKKVDRRKISTDTMDLFVWDMGGQEDYRRDYLSKPESYFVRTDLVIYVIDMQDPLRYNESFEYLQNILDILKLMNENPYILAFMHKSDPDILEDPEFQINTEFVADKMNYMLNSYDFEFDIYTTSIYNFFTSEPKFSKFIKETLSDKDSLNNPMIRKMEGMGDILDSTLNAIVTLANSLGEQISALSSRLDMIESRLNNSLMSMPLNKEVKSQKSSEIIAPQMSTKSTSNPQQVIYTRKNLGLNPPPTSSEPSEQDITGGDSRLEILKDLQGLFQAKRNLDASHPLNKLGSLGKKFEKINKEIPTNDVKSSKKKSTSKKKTKSKQ